MFTTKIRGSGFKETLRQAPIGFELTCESPEGEFVLREGEANKRHVFIAGGIGVTPYRSILRYRADTHEPLRRAPFELQPFLSRHSVSPGTGGHSAADADFFIR